METRGRPTKFSVEIINKLKEAFAIGAGVEEACFYAEIDKGTYYNWIKDNEVLFNEFQRLKQKPILKARQEVVKGLEGNPEFSLKYLERKKKDEFSLRTETDITTQGNPFNSITVTYIDKLESEGNEASEDNTGEGSGI